MGRKSLKNKASDFAWRYLLTTGALHGVNAIGNSYLDNFDTDIWWPFAAGMIVTCVHELSEANGGRPAIPNFTLATGRLTHGTMMRVDRGSWLASATRLLRYKEPKPQAVGEFFWEIKIPERRAPVVVRETRLLKFCQQAFERQQSGYVHPMSRNYFVREVGWPLAQYAASTTILFISNLIEGRGQGSSGRLIHPPAMTVRYAKHGYPPTH